MKLFCLTFQWKHLCSQLHLRNLWGSFPLMPACFSGQILRNVCASITTSGVQQALLERVLTHLFDFVLEGSGPSHCRLKCEELLCCNVLSALNPNTASRANTDHTCWCLNWDCKFGVNAGVSCKSIVNLQCPSSWHGSMEMVSTPGEMESTHWTVLGGIACCLRRHTDTRELKGEMRESEWKRL